MKNETEDEETKSQPKSEENSKAIRDDEPSQEQDAKPASSPQQKKGWSFWVIFFALAMTGLLTALETTITSTALPVITHDLHGDHLYIWVINAYILSMYVVARPDDQLLN